MKILTRLVLVVAITAAGVLGVTASPAYASGPTTNTSTAVRHCTDLTDSSCQQIKWYIPAGTPVTMRCWTDESVYAGTNRWFWIDGNGVQGFVSANNISYQTTVGWCNGMREMQAVRWAGSHLGELYDAELCLKFVHDAWANWGSGIDIGGNGQTAYQYWQTHQSQQVPHVVNAPIGALVFWAPTGPPYDPYYAGHVAISIGDDYAISTDEEGTHEVHVLNMDNRNNNGYYTYLGYIMP